MASAVAYDPYDDIDNNPFSEPRETTTIPQESGAHETDDPSETSTPTVQHENPQSDEMSLELVPERKANKFQLVVKVTGLERIGTFTNKKENPTLKFDVSTNLPTFRKPQHRNIKKTMTEFQNLFTFLNGSIPETFVPALPVAHTNYGISNSEDYYKTVKNFQEWFDRIAADPLILRSEEIAFFIESDFNTYTPVGKSKLPVSGLKRKTLKQLTPPFDECLELAEFRPLVKSIRHLSQDIQLKLLKLSKLRKSVSQDENAVGKGFKEMAQDPSQTQSHSKFYIKFGKTLTAVGDIDSVMATLDVATLYDGLEWIAQDTYVVKESLTNRHFLMRDLLQAQQNSRFRQEQARKLRAKRDVSPLKVDDAIRALKVATTTEHELTLKLRRITANMLLQKREWLEWYDKTLINSIKEYTVRKIEYERKKLSLLERIRSDVRAVDEAGGLSRLGRGTGVVRDGSTATKPSQSAQGDSWTNDRRSRAFEPSVLKTEFDASLENEQGVDEITEDQYTLDARSAAHLLGSSSF
ncbi:LANO_0H21594g1_1 [Lachancea nothofagi CBS 11611]|uniref:Vacuolar protein sorting-associated protein 17 n=1 Tax=Lachancea nothofagi CBS 11611 TaxID=1266666 RepID=A0A1G4KNT5_9SACH|nr:LANO_0H21594g1_1 [Lachancea nothofagi CBS 11611]